jgi:hypothetical protein
MNDIDDELKCLICKHPLRSPVSHTLCHYDFCQDCIEIWLEQNRTCPICEQSLNDKIESINLLEIFSFVPISTRIVLNRLDELLVQCILCKEENIKRSNNEGIPMNKTFIVSPNQSDSDGEDFSPVSTLHSP